MWMCCVRISSALMIGLTCGVVVASYHSPQSTADDDDELTGPVSPYILQVSTNYNALYGPWSRWSRCNDECVQKRNRSCTNHTMCRLDNRLVERRRCRRLTDAHRCLPRISRRWGLGSKIRDVMYDIVYESWSEWSACTRSCKQRRIRTCSVRRLCKDSVLMEERRCYVKNSACNRKPGSEDEAREEEQDRHPVEESDRETTQAPEHDDVPSGSESHEVDDITSGSVSGLVPTEFTTSVESGHLNKADTCGTRSVSGSLRIVGGQEARPGSWPWQVAILTRWREQYCAGVLVHPQWVLTAAHCLRKKARHRKVIIRTGEYDLSVSEGSELDHRSFTAFIHPDFNLETIDSDIALVKLAQPVTNNTEVMNVACVPDESDVLLTRTLCHAVGWGKMKNTHRFGTDVLREASVPLVDHERCQDAFEFEITRNQMCAGYRKGGSDTCAGDSGGPLMCEIRHGGTRRWYVYGVTSFGEGCGDRGKYGIYTKVVNFSEWIIRTMEEN